jgi:hypothetical protein
VPEDPDKIIEGHAAVNEEKSHSPLELRLRELEEKLQPLFEAHGRRSDFIELAADYLRDVRNEIENIRKVRTFILAFCGLYVAFIVGSMWYIVFIQSSWGWRGGTARASYKNF